MNRRELRNASRVDWLIWSIANRLIRRADLDGFRTVVDLRRRGRESTQHT